MFLALDNISVKSGGEYILRDITLHIQKGEQWAVTGPSGSGKTTLAKVMAGTIFFHGSRRFENNRQPSIVLVEQQHRFRNLSNTNDFYYQQRFNSFDAENSLTTLQALEDFTGKKGSDQEVLELISLLHLEPILQKPLIQLSNGENKRLQLAEALALRPELLILDNPFTGLDTEGRSILHRIINTIAASGTQLILVTSPDGLPSCISHIAVLKEGHLESFLRNDFEKPDPDKPISFIPLLKNVPETSKHGFALAIKMVNVSVKYADKTVLDQINWEVKRGECWSISGPNGAGKSTLLSLINADNPQAYANEIYLFDKRRGRGESIWDIKKMTGYVSPELHLNFDAGSNCFNIVASGLFDTIGLFRQLDEEQEEITRTWMSIMQLGHLAHKNLFQLSLGQQRMVLLARALVKNPPLLVLDEPCQGLDKEQTDFFNRLVDQLCGRYNTTLLYVTHYKEQLPVCISYFLELKNGQQVK